MQIPAYPRHLTEAERRALLMQTARDMADETIREGGFDPVKIDRDRIEAEAATLITMSWLTERVTALEAKP